MEIEAKFYTPHISQDHNQSVMEMKEDVDGAWVARADFEKVVFELQVKEAQTNDSASA